MRRRLTAVLAALAVPTAACTGGNGDRPAAGEPYDVIVSAPLTTSPWVGQFIERGARLAVDEVNATGGVGETGRDLRLVVLDNAGSPRAAVAAARRAVTDGAAALVTDGVGAAGIADVSDPAGLPVFVVFDGGGSVVDPEARPTVFRIAPANRVMATRLADYVSGLDPRVAVVSDSTSYGRDGLAAMRPALERNRIPLVAAPVVPPDGDGIAPQVLDARRRGATMLVVWGSTPVVAATLRAARSAAWDVPIYAGPTAEDPLLRQQLADRREWVDGLRFVSFRITAEVGPEPYEKFRRAYEEAFGVDEVGVQEDGEPVVMPPDWAMFSYDAVHLVAAALARSGEVGHPLMSALDQTVTVGANGDERGFLPGQREGVSPDDMYFAEFDGFRFRPVTDDLLSENLPPVQQ